jgi:Macrocin-O-methyltransferase (TylF)
MHPSVKKRILGFIEREGYVVTKVGDYQQREQLMADYEAELTQRADRIAQLEKLRGYHEAELTQRADRIAQLEKAGGNPAAEPIRQGPRQFPTNQNLRSATVVPESAWCDPDERVAELEADLAKRAELLTRKLVEADHEFRLGRERDARELEAARAETWDLNVLAAELRNQLDRARQQQTEQHDLLSCTLDENRRLKIRVEEVPQIDYQVLMREQHERAAFQDADPAFAKLYERVKDFSMTSIERLYAMHKATEYVCRAGIQGSIVECGVWRGGSMMMAALTLQSLGDTSRELYLFDTYEGLPKPNANEDVDLWGHSAYNEWTRHRRTDESSDWALASLEEVRANLASTGYPSENLLFVKGMVQKTLPTSTLERIALLRLDTDWYESTICELENLYPLLTHNGVLIIDDYGHMRGQRKAVDEYFVRNGPFILLNRVDYSGRIGVKTAVDSVMAALPTPPAAADLPTPTQRR